MHRMRTGAPRIRSITNHLDARTARLRLPALLATIAAAFVATQAGSAGSAIMAAPPEPCLGVPQITDPAGDGHHVPTDVLAAWFSEDAGHLQAVIKVKGATPAPEHDDADQNGAGLVMLFKVDGTTKYVRATIPFVTDGPPEYDYGTYASGVFTSLGMTTGSLFTASAGGSATIDVPAATGATDGVLLDDPFVLTYDGIVNGVGPTQVDHAPGGVSWNDPSRGADYVVGSCGDDPDTTVAVQLSAPSKVVGGGKSITVTGLVLPARGGVGVELERKAFSTVVSNLVTEDDGTFAVTIPLRETTRLHATAEGISSQTLTVKVRSTVRISARRLRTGARRITGTVRPILPGKLLLLRRNAFRPAQQTTRIRKGKFTFMLTKRARPGRFQVVFVPRGGRAERSTSNTVRVR